MLFKNPFVRNNHLKNPLFIKKYIFYGNFYEFFLPKYALIKNTIPHSLFDILEFVNSVIVYAKHIKRDI